MKSILMILLVIFSVKSFAGTYALFQLYRTNYYTEKTVQYVVKVKDTSCEFDGSKPVKAYFVNTSNSQYHSELNAASVFSQNKKYMGPRIQSKSDDYLIFDFRSLKEAAASEGKSYAIGVELEKKGSKCVPLVSFLNSSNESIMTPFKRIEVEFKLVEMTGFGMQPESVNWAKIKGSGSRCVVGSCP